MYLFDSSDRTWPHGPRGPRGHCGHCGHGLSKGISLKMCQDVSRCVIRTLASWRLSVPRQGPCTSASCGYHRHSYLQTSVQALRWVNLTPLCKIYSMGWIIVPLINPNNFSVPNSNSATKSPPQHFGWSASRPSPRRRPSLPREFRSKDTSHFFCNECDTYTYSIIYHIIKWLI